MDTKKPTVLVVDDMPDNLILIGGLLQDNYKVRIAIDGKNALKIASAEPPPDLILLDVMMPKMDGFEVCRHLQNDLKTRGIPVIFLTALEETQDEQRGLDLGAVDFIAKSSSTPIVLARIRTHIRLKQQATLLESLAMIDGLTHIPNRRRFDEVLDVEWRRSCRDSSMLTLLMVEIDSFKDYNDHYGRGLGDTCLTQVAAAMSARFKQPGDLVARYSSDVFAAVLPNTDCEGARQLADQLRFAMDSLYIPHTCSDNADHMTVSIGFTSALATKGQTVSSLRHSAKRWLYEAKSKGRNRVEGGILAAEGESS